MFEKGSAKPEKSGRKAGTPNKRTNKVLEILEKNKYDPLVEAIKILKTEPMSEDEKELAYHRYVDELSRDEEIMPEDIPSFKEFKKRLEANELSAKERLDGHLKLMRYVYPARKAIEIVSDDGKEAPKFIISLTKPEGD